MNVFTYGTLMVPLIFKKIIGRECAAQEALLRGYGRFRLSDVSYPAMVEKKGGSVCGRVYAGVDRDAMARLDAFEGKRYDRVEVTVALRTNRTVTAQAYVLRDAFRHLLTNRPWCLEEFREKDQDAFLRSFSGFDRCRIKQ